MLHLPLTLRAIALSTTLTIGLLPLNVSNTVAQGPQPMRAIHANSASLPEKSTTEENALPTDPTSAILKLANGDQLVGEWIPSGAPNMLNWRGEIFTEPFEFSWDKVEALEFPFRKQKDPLRPLSFGDFHFELTTADSFYGDLVRVDAKSILVEVPRIGRLTIHRNALRRMTRHQGQKLHRRILKNQGPLLETRTLSHPQASEPRQDLAGQAGIYCLDGTSLPDSVIHYDQQTRQLVLGETAQAPRVALQNLASWILKPTPQDILDSSSPRNSRALQGSQISPRPNPSIKIRLQEGHQFQGELLRLEGPSVVKTPPGEIPVDSYNLRVRSPAFLQPLVLPIDQLRSLVVFQADSTQPTQAIRKDQNFGRLEARGTHLQGNLVADTLPAANRLQTPRDTPPTLSQKSQHDSEQDSSATRIRPPEAPLASCLRWQPVQSNTASPLKAFASARIIFRDPPIPQKKSARKKSTPRTNTNLSQVTHAAMEAFVDPKIAPAPPATLQTLSLRPGDSFACKVLQIDPAGVQIETADAETRLVPNALVKGLVMGPLNRKINLGKREIDRLLTLPRQNQDNPPTHLVCSIHGDFLRGHLLKMDAQSIQMEVRLNTITLPRELVSYILWFYEDELEEPTAPKKASPMNPEPKNETASPVLKKLPPYVHAVHRDGHRTTFTAKRLMPDAPKPSDPDILTQIANRVDFRKKPVAVVLHGTSPVLGECAIQLTKIDRLLLGEAIDQEAAGLVPQSWRLHHAQLPNFEKIDSRN